jgi:hypothetical protein
MPSGVDCASCSWLTQMLLIAHQVSAGIEVGQVGLTPSMLRKNVA